MDVFNYFETQLEILWITFSQASFCLAKQIPLMSQIYKTIA